MNYACRNGGFITLQHFRTSWCFETRVVPIMKNEIATLQARILTAIAATLIRRNRSLFGSSFGQKPV